MRLPTAVQRLHYGGLIVGATGFLVTRLVVAETIQADMAVPFLVAGLIPLVVGLGVSVFGVVLAVGAVPRRYVKTVSVWCLIGTGGMVLVLGVTAIESMLRSGTAAAFPASGTLVANVLLGGTVAGILIGDRSAVNRRQRGEIRRQANRGVVLNRLLRDEVLNAVAVVSGYAPYFENPEEAPEGAGDAIREATRQIETTVEEVGAIAEDPGDGSLGSVDLAAHLSDQIEALRTRLPDTRLRIDDRPESVAVRGDDRLGIALRGLLRHAVESAHGGEIHLDVTATREDAQVTVRYEGSPLEEGDLDLIQSGELPEYDDPTVGFDLQIAWLLVDRYGGRIDPTNEDGDTRITIAVPRARQNGDADSPIGVSRANLARVSVAGLLAGVVMGLSIQALAGGLPVIGALYGVENAVVGWVTHLFHSVVFALLFVAGCTWPPVQERAGSIPGTTLLAVAWGVFLALIAAGFVMPAWLQATGFRSMLPNLSGPGMFGHVLWGATLGVTYGLFREYEVGSGETIRRILASRG
ncbi:MAG: sensor histidine kinase [Halobacteriales archaeon]